MNNYDRTIENLNNENIDVRLNSLAQLAKMIEAGKIGRPEAGTDVNNHIHTTYSFSPYSPTKAVWMAYTAGLATAGIIDHDSISGAEEFIKAGRIAGISTTIGVECRADFSKTILHGRKINNPDQHSIAYVAIHGIPHTQINDVKSFFSPFTEQRNLRNMKMVDRINGLVSYCGIKLDFHTDILPLSMSHEGGSITERHILYALSKKLIDEYGNGRNLLDILENKLNLNISTTIQERLLDINNPYHEYDLLGLLKGEMVSSFYIDALEECPDIRDISSFSKQIGGILAYAYLGDVGDSVTGDKRSQKFEDEYLDSLFEVISEIGFNAVTYMPSRNTFKQLNRVMDLCDRYSLFQISGEDINSPRQSFICMAQRDESFSHLIDAAWALIGHENEATKDLRNGMFSTGAITKYPDLKTRITAFRDIGIASREAI